MLVDVFHQHHNEPKQLMHERIERRKTNRVREKNITHHQLAKFHEDYNLKMKQDLHRHPEKNLQMMKPVKPYLWDNWIVDIGQGNDHLLGRISLEADRALHRDERHLNAKVGLYLPGLDGNYIKFCNVTEEAPSWSGSALNLSKIGREHDLNNLFSVNFSKTDPDLLHLFDKSTIKQFQDTAIIIPYTSIMTKEPQQIYGSIFPQVISVSYKMPGETHFRTLKEVLNPYLSNDPNLKYYKINDSEHVPSAFRDPFLYFENGKYHMFFSARYSETFFNELPKTYREKHSSHPVYERNGITYDDEVNSTIGHATSDNLKDWKLHKPLLLPGNATQFELPALIKGNDGYHLMVVVSDGYVSNANPDLGNKLFGPRHQYVIGFKTKKSLDDFEDPHAWDSHESIINKDTHPLKRTYGLTFNPVGEKVFATAFNEDDLTLTRVVEVPRNGFPYNFPSENNPDWHHPAPEMIALRKLPSMSNIPSREDKRVG
jgi:hypothetical protein